MVDNIWFFFTSINTYVFSEFPYYLPPLKKALTNIKLGIKLNSGIDAFVFSEFSHSIPLLKNGID